MTSYNGWLNVDKPYSFSSTKVVSIIRYLLKTKKVGHAGTLDPLATGVLPIAVGEATKTIKFVQNNVKEYLFDTTFGIKTDTGDKEGKVIGTSDIFPNKQDVIDIIPSFIGDVKQKPPIYSAIKINGKRSYALARSGIIPDIKSRFIRIEELELMKFDATNSTIRFKVVCSKGTYIRSLGEDIAEKLNSVGHITYLRRTKVGNFCTKNIISLENIKILVHNGTLIERMLSIEQVLDDIPVLDFCKEDAKKIKNGMCIPVNLLEDSKSEYYLSRYKDTLLAIGSVSDELFHPIRVFNIN